jgi:hypothetical protein
MISIDETVSEVRKQLDEVTLTGDLAVYAQEFEDLFSSEFSDDDLRDRVLDGARYLSARVRARYQPDNVRQLSSGNAGEITPSEDRILDDPRGDNVQPMIRVLPTRVEIGGNEAQRRTLLGNEKIEDTGRSATASEPAYAYQDFEFIPEQGGGTGNVTADVVDLVKPTNASFDGVSWTYNDGGTSEVPLPELLQEALVQYVVRSCFLTLRAPDMAKFARRRMVNELGPYALPGIFSDVNEQNDEDS